jgi:ribosome-binding protein aMBF1 (putative translation factor)
MKISNRLSVKINKKGQKIGDIYNEITNGLNSKSLSMDTLRQKINEASSLINQIERADS